MLTLRSWARSQGIPYQTAHRWFHAGKLPVKARQLPSGSIVIEQERPQPLHTSRSDNDQSVTRRAFLRVAYERLADPANATYEERWASRVMFLIQAREAHGLSQSALDARIGWAEGLTAKYEALTRRPTTQQFEYWMMALDLDLDFVPAKASALTSKSDPPDNTRAHTPR